MTKASIVIPAYQRVGQTLRTIKLLQSSAGWGIEFKAEIIVADSSPDDQLKKTIDDKFTGEVIYTKPSKAGIAANKNQGAKLSKYPILIFCDSDIEVEQNTLVNTLQALKKHPTAAAVAGKVIWRGGKKDGGFDRPRPEDRIKVVSNTTYIEAIYSRFMATYKKVFWLVGGYDDVAFNMRGEGADLSIRYWRAGYPLIYDDLIVVHHVYQTEGGIVRHVKHPEWGTAKDLLLLFVKYDMLEGKFANSAKTVAANFAPLGSYGYYRIIQGIGQNLQFISKVLPKINKKKLKAEYEFKFLEVFSQPSLFKNCLKSTKKRLEKIRKRAFDH